ncbi:MAG TPA: extracellular solute-binding protein [Beijerinckiaceae bacterium]|jgi:microcin C transport system substrate-binding protein
MSGPTRRTLLRAGAALGVAAALPVRGFAQAETESHGLSTFGDLKYRADFRRFDYANPNAPKGGAISLQISSTTGNQAFDTFNTLNVYVLKGDGAAGVPLTFDSLMVRALDEPDALYGLVARGVRASADGLTYRFLLRPEARFHDGSRLTARDVAFSLNAVKTKGHPRLSQTLRLMTGVEAEGSDVVKVTFSPERGRDLPLVVAALPIFSESYWRDRNFEESTLEAPLGSGPYKVGRFEAGRFIELDRVPDYWAKDLPVTAGYHNFDRIRYEYFRDRQVALEAFKAGAFTYREEFTSRDWVHGYDFPAAREGKVRREVLADATPSGTQGWFFNTRRDKFKDPRVREAIGLVFDFEWTNTNLMFGTYQRTASFFENSDLKAEGRPGPDELALLEPFRGKVPDEVFGEPYSPPRSDGSGQDRALLRRADQLLREAGCKRDGNVMRLPNGQPLEIEFIDYSPALQPHTQPFIKNLGLVGIQARSRLVDAAQYQARVKDFDFDVTSTRFSGGPTPGEALREVYSSRSAAAKGSSNLAGISDPAIDALLERVVQAKSSDELRTACKALDRVLRAGRYWVPMWYSASHRVATWDVFGRPDPLPRYDLGVPTLWWYDAEKAKRIGRA